MITEKELKEMSLIDKLKLFRALWDNISYDDISEALGDLSDTDWARLDDIINGIDAGNNCSECGHKLSDEDLTTSTECEEFWGAPAHYDIVVGYCCSECGYHEVY